MSSKREKIKNDGIRFSKFSMVGLMNAVVDIGVLNLFLWLASTRDPTTLALYNGIALVLANVSSYVGNTLWTFRKRAVHDRRQTVLFVLQAILNVGVGTTLFWGLVHPLFVYTDIPTYLVGNVAKFISIVVASTMSFIIMRYLVFSDKKRFGGRL